jgi:hypothetical protein
MPIHWTAGRDAFDRLLRQRGLDPSAVGHVGAAWEAFAEFVQIELDGVEPAEDDGDGFIVQWGMGGPQTRRPVLSFTRQLAVSDRGERVDEFWQPELWSVELELVFADGAAWADLDEMAWRDTGFDFGPIGPRRADALRQTLEFACGLPQVKAMWEARPEGRSLILQRVD